MSAALLASDVSKYFGDFPAIRRVTLEAPSGAILALLGRNGAGKTTLLQMLAGVSQPTLGTVTIGAAPPGADPRRHIGVVGHGLWLYDDLTAEENLAFFARLYGVPGAPVKIGQWLEESGLERFRRSRVAEFSRGMRQRLAIARAFLHDPDVLLLDEPWTALDDRAIAFLSSKILDAQSRGRTAVVCSHQLREALQIATHVAVLERGRLAYSGLNTPELRAAPESLYERIS